MPITQHRGRTFDVELVQDVRHEPYLLERQPEGAVLDRVLRSHEYKTGGILDQGPNGACVGFGCAGNCGCTPKAQPHITNATGFGLYHEAQDRDEWPGHNYEGTSLTGGMKALQFEKRISNYLWLSGATQVALAIGYKSPVVIAIDWTENMMDVDSDGLIHATGATVGGHCVNLCGFELKTRLFKVQQSWGVGWGRAGFAFLGFDDLENRLAGNGQAAITRKLTLAA